jgi:UPF0716 protein FxsA
MRALLILAAIPLIEIALFIQVGSLIGVWATIGLLLLSALLGVLLARRQTREVLRGMQAAAARGDDPSDRIIDAFLVVVAGGLLIVPGFLTDALGLLLLLPAVRAALLRGFGRRIARRTVAFRFRGQAAAGGESVIEGQSEEIAYPRAPTHRPSGWTLH